MNGILIILLVCVLNFGCSLADDMVIRRSDLSNSSRDFKLSNEFGQKTPGPNESFQLEFNAAGYLNGLDVSMSNHNTFLIPGSLAMIQTSKQMESDDNEIVDTATAIETGDKSAFIFNSDSIGQDSIRLSISSDPDSSLVLINSSSDTLKSPALIIGPPGSYNVQAFKPGYTPLARDIELKADQHSSVHFILQSVQPDLLTADHLDLEYQSLMPLRDEKEAKVLKDKLMNLTATFSIIPLGQGVLARLVLNEDHRDQTDILIISGMVLTSGTLILSQVLPSRKLKEIRRHNENAAAVNLGVQAHNQDVDKRLKQRNDQIYEEWLSNNKNRGKVEIDIQ